MAAETSPRLTTSRIIGRRLHQSIVDHRWWLFAGLAAGTIALGTAGYLDSQGGPALIPDALYASLQLFALEISLSGHALDWKLQTARFLAPTLAAAGTAGAIHSVITALGDGIPAWRRRDHVIVCGLGRKGVRLATRLAEERGTRVVVIEDDATLVESERRNAHPLMTIVHGDATDRRVLHRAGLPAARALFAVTGSDAANAAIAVQAQEEIQRRHRAKPLVMRTHIVDPELNGLLRPILERDDASLCSHLVNVYASAASGLVDEHAQSNPADNGAVIIVGFGRLGQQLLIELAARLLAGNSPSTMLVVDREATKKIDEFQRRYPDVAGLCHLRPHDEDITTEPFEEGDYLDDLKGETIASVFVCLGDDELGLVTALTIARSLNRNRHGAAPIRLRVTHEGAGFGLLLAGDPIPPPYETVVAFDIHRMACDPGVFLGETHTTTG